MGVAKHLSGSRQIVRPMSQWTFSSPSCASTPLEMASSRRPTTDPRWSWPMSDVNHTTYLHGLVQYGGFFKSAV